MGTDVVQLLEVAGIGKACASNKNGNRNIQKPGITKRSKMSKQGKRERECMHMPWSTKNTHKAHTHTHTWQNAVCAWKKAKSKVQQGGSADMTIPKSWFRHYCNTHQALSPWLVLAGACGATFWYGAKKQTNKQKKNRVRACECVSEFA